MNRPTLILTLLTAVTLTACGGGGGGGSPTVHANPPAVAPSNPTPPQNPTPPEQPQQPSQPNPSTPNETNKDAQTLSALSAYAPLQGGSVSHLLNISLGGDKNIQLDMVPPNVLAQSRVQTLRDKAGNLVGYYAYARVDEPQKDAYGDPLVPKLHHLYLLNAAESLRQLPTSDMRYTGSMLYQHFVNQMPDGVMREADVQANYSSSNKTMKMTIHDSSEGKTWVLRDARSPSAATQVAVNDNGSMTGFLFEEYNKAVRPQFNGHFDGGFYGENGSVLTGTAHYDGNDAAGTGKWQGVIGATAQ